MPQVSPMKWSLINLIMQLVILEMNSTLSYKIPINESKNHNITMNCNKINWKW